MRKKMIKRSSLVIILVLLGVVFSSCSLGSNDTKVSGFSIGRGSSSSGGSGVDLEFAEGNPTSEMFKAQPYTFAFVFKNNQEHEINDLEIRPKGFDYSYVQGLFTSHVVQKIPKATKQTGPGIYAGLVVQGVRVDGFVGDYQFNPVFDYCYSAKTQFREQICVPSIENKCDTKIDTSTTQNGPLSVNIDHVNSLANDVRVDFTVNNKGSGKIVNTCFNTKEYANAYTLSSVKLGSATGNCEAISGYQILNGQSKFYCTFQRTSEDSYASQLVVVLDYKYEQEMQKKIVVRDLTQGYN